MQEPPSRWAGCPNGEVLQLRNGETSLVLEGGGDLMNVPPVDIPFFLAIGLSLVFGLCLAIWVGRVLTHDAHPPVDTERALQLSSERYRPMLRLLNEDDLAFLRAQPGYRPSMAAKLRAQRCQIFRTYLRSLDSDFKLLCAAIKTLIVQSHQDRPDLARALFRSQFRFAAGMWSARFKILFYRLGLASVDATGLVTIFDVTRARLRDLAPAQATAGI
ncbi:MAG TPA: hypothetical protein VML19_21350 [Verrucomicrobiae bacterium]|nr:hypothetical protein [Verrucomicrobiae bacterium]